MARATLFAQLEEIAGSSPWIEDLRGRRSLADVLVASALFAHELRETAGHLEKAHVLLQGEPSAAWLSAFLAITRAGGVVVPVALGVPEPELRYFQEDCGAHLAVVTHTADVSFPSGVRVIRAADRGGLQSPTSSTLVELVSLYRPEPEDPALVLYTSGTTGKPKGAVLTHASLAAQTAILRDAWALRDDDVLLHTLPMHHLHGIVVALLASVTAGASVIMLPRFEASRVISEMERATIFMAVPTIYQRLFEAFDGLDEPTRDRFRRSAAHLRLATSGSAALPRSLAERWKALSGSIPLERYGMTEIGMALSNSLEPTGRRAGAVGRPLPTVDVRLVDENGRDTDGPGELWVRGPSLFAGYLGRPEATTAAFRDGWFVTGDIGVRDEEGVFRLLGRASVDILKSGGEKISALEVEETLRDHPAILEVAVVGLPDETWGDRVVAVVVARAGRENECDEASIRAWAKERLAPFKVPREVRLLPALPRNAMGKVVKPDVVAKLASLKS